MDVALGELHQVVTGDLLGELEEADAVQRVDLPLQELAAELHHLGELQHVSSDDQLLNVVLPDVHHPCGHAQDSGAPLEAAAVGQPPPPATSSPARPSGDRPRSPPSATTCVDKVEERVEGVRLDARDPHHIPAGLLHAAREERREVGAAGRQHQAVHGERLRAHLQPHIAEALPGPQPVDLGQQEAGVPVGEGAAAGLGRRGARHCAPRAGGTFPRPAAAAPRRRAGACAAAAPLRPATAHAEVWGGGGGPGQAAGGRRRWGGHGGRRESSSAEAAGCCRAPCSLSGRRRRICPAAVRLSHRFFMCSPLGAVGVVRPCRHLWPPARGRPACSVRSSVACG